MKKFIIPLLILLPTVSLAFTVPEKPTGFVQDYAQILNQDQVNQLEAKLEAYEKQSTNEIAVVVIPSLDGDTIENVAQEIFTKWGIGKKDKNNGVLLLISIAERKTRIQTGYGVEGDLTDVATSYIQSDTLAPAFRQGDYFGGINSAVDEMIKSLGGNRIVPTNYSQNNWLETNWRSLIVIIIVFVQLLSALLAPSKSWWAGGVIGGVAALIIWLIAGFSIFWGLFTLILLIGSGLLLDYIVSKAYTEKKTTGRYPWWFFWGGGGGRGGGMGGGGFGGFGGGGSGGGGSSGSW